MLKILLAVVLPIIANSAAADDRLNLSFSSGQDDGQITILANSADFSGTGSDFKFEGNVEVIQGDMVFRSEEVNAFLSEDRSHLDIIGTRGGATVEWPRGTAEADYATYRVAEGLIGMYGNLTVMTGTSRLAGYGLVYDVENGRGRILKKEEFEPIFPPDG